MKVQLLTLNQMHRFGAQSVDDVVEVPDALAADLIAQGIARSPLAAAPPPENETSPHGSENASGPGGKSAGGKAGVKGPKG